MKDNINLQDGFKIRIQKKNPKANPVTHELVTVQDIFNAVHEKNINRFIRDFKQALNVGINTRNLINIIAKEEAKKDGVDLPEGIASLIMPSLTWIED